MVSFFSGLSNSSIFASFTGTKARFVTFATKARKLKLAQVGDHPDPELVRTRNQLKKELAGINSEEYLGKKWDALFKTVRQRIARVMRPGQDQHRVLNASEIECFRNCISELTLFQHRILVDKSKDLFAVVGDICAYGRSSIATTHPALIALLEVFIKEVLVHPTLWHLLDRSTQQIPEASGVPSIRKLMLGHLYLSFPKQICPNFTDSFCRSLAMSTALHDGGISEVGLGLGLGSTLALLNTSFSSPIPYLVQAHLAVLASRCIETQNPGLVLGPGFDRAISAFELSAKLYWRCLCDLDLGQRLRPYLSRGAKKPPPNHAPDCHMDEMIRLFGTSRSDEGSQKNLFLRISSYIDEIQQIVHASTRLQTGDALKGIVSMLLADKVLVKKQAAGCKISEELVSLAALARLMASSLFRAVAEARTMVGRAQKAGRREKDLELEGQLMGSVELESNAGHCLVGRKADQIVQKILLDAISVGSSSRKRSVLMLKHFVKLMLVGLRARVDFLWKACVLVLSAIMNLMAFEGEEFDALKMLSGYAAHEPVETTKGSNHKRKSTAKQLDTSVLPNTKRLHRVDDDLVNGEGSCQSKDGICDSQVFTEERISKFSANLSENVDLVDFFKHPPEDLVDFLDCSADMDLPCWLREREGLFKSRQAAQKRKRKMLSKLLGMRI